MDTHFRIFVCLKVAFFDKLYRFNDIPAWGSYTNETPSLYLMEWKEVNKDNVSLSWAVVYVWSTKNSINHILSAAQLLLTI